MKYSWIRQGIAMAAYLTKYRRTQYRPKLKYTALLQNLTKLDNLKSSLAIYHYVKVQQLDDICETRR
jgi:hypothetical protein